MTYSLETFSSALDIIRPLVSETPVTFDSDLGLYLKWESHQTTNSFKIRGAFHRILAQKPIPKSVITGSAGNHGLAVAYAGSLLGFRVQVFIPKATPLIKRNKMLELGADIIEVPGLFEHAEKAARSEAQLRGIPFIPPYNDRDVILGAGTIALEWLRQTPEIRRLLVPVGGGGLICGIGLAAKAIDPSIEVTGVLSEASPYLHQQFYEGHMDAVVESSTLTDGLAGAVEPGSITIDLLPRAVDQIIKVSEQDVMSGIGYCFRVFDETVEGAGAVGIGSVLGNKISPHERPTGALITGGNIDRTTLDEVLSKTGDPSPSGG